MSIFAPNISVARQDNTTNSTLAGARIETGWGWMLGVAASFMNETVTFSRAFATAPVVIITSLGEMGSDPTAITSFTGASGMYCMANGITTTTFVAYMLTRDNTNLITTQRYGYTWIAIG